MSELSDTQAMALERSCALTAVALSQGRRSGVNLVTGQHRRFGVNLALDTVHVPYPPPHRDLWCGAAVFAVEGADHHLSAG